MQVIDHVVRAGMGQHLPITDAVSLTWEERGKSRQKLRTTQGREIALALPTGTRLQRGGVLPPRRPTED